MRRHIVRAAAVAAFAATLVVGSAISAFACGALVGPNGTISLTRTTTLAAYHNSREPYLTAFEGIADGQAIPVHVVIPTPNPWVPLRILTLGRQPQDVIQADVFLLTDRDPAMLPQALSPDGSSDQQGTILERSGWASNSLMSDL